MMSYMPYETSHFPLGESSIMFKIDLNMAIWEQVWSAE